MPDRIDGTLAALNDLVEKSEPDLQPQFKRFSSQLAELTSEAQAIADARRKMSGQTKEFFATWDEQLAQIQNEDIKARSQGRRAAVAETLHAIKRSYSESDPTFRPFLRDLQDVQKYLSGGPDAGRGGRDERDGGQGQPTCGCAQGGFLHGGAAAFRALGVSMSAAAPWRRQSEAIWTRAGDEQTSEMRADRHQDECSASSSWCFSCPEPSPNRRQSLRATAKPVLCGDQRGETLCRFGELPGVP